MSSIFSNPGKGFTVVKNSTSGSKTSYIGNAQYDAVEAANDAAIANGSAKTIVNNAVARNKTTSAVKNPVSASLGTTSLNDILQTFSSSVADLSDKTNALAAQSAATQNAWQVEQNAKAMEFSSNEAQKTRDWNEYMSNTAHQREVSDLIAAGLNPVLSANSGADYSSVSSAQGVTSSGTKAEVDMNRASIVGNLIANYMQCQASMQNAATNAQAVLGAANINGAYSYAIRELANEASNYSADKASEASHYGSDTSYAGTKYSSDSSNATRRGSTMLDTASKIIQPLIWNAAKFLFP